MIKYKIIEIHPEQHSIVVRFYSATVTESSLATQWGDGGEIRRGRTDYNIDLPVPAPVGEELKKLIMAHAPVVWLKTQEDILNPAVDTSMASVVALLGMEVSALAPIAAAPPTTIFDVGAAPT